MRYLLALIATLAWAQLTERDLKFVKQPPITGAVGIPRSYALVVGISEYAKLPPRGQLKFPSRDAAAIYAALISPEGGQFPPENVHRLIGKQATLANLRKELEEWLPSVSKDGDRVLIYFAGHGFVSGGQAYLAPYDIDLADIPGTSYSMKTLGQVVGGRIKAKWKVLLTDACHSGAITPEADASQINTSLVRIDQSLFSLTASRDREQSFESDIWGGGHGVFTYYVMKAIEGEADDNRDGVVTADELAEYVRVNVRQQTSAKQNHTAERGSFDPQMILAYNPSRTVKAPGQAPKFGGLVIETNMDGVEIFVDGKSAGTINKDKPLRIPGLLPGVHTVKGVRMGYEPDGPREETVYPGQETTVSVRITIARRRPKAALDAFDDGLELYQKGFEKNYRAAAAAFQKALAIDPKYSQAALYLGRTYNALYDTEKAKEAFKLAIEIDPDYAEARASYGGMLLDLGDLDESIRQLNASVVKEPGNSLTHSLLAQAFIRKGALSEGERFARESIKLNAGHAEAHFWLAEGLRFGKQCGESRREYSEYLRLSDFDSKLAGKLNYYVLGYLAGIGKKKRAAQTDIWRELQFMAHFGLCDCARMSKEYDVAIRSCQQALSLDNADLFAHYALGVTYAEKFNAQKSAGLLAAAKTHFEAVVKLNPEAVEAEKAKKYVTNINQVLVAIASGATP
jgi:uncharacterized caspase-like protein/tetratricopeptide (TPR) repeat protein